MPHEFTSPPPYPEEYTGNIIFLKDEEWCIPITRFKDEDSIFLTLEEFSHEEGLFDVEVKHFGKLYKINLYPLYEAVMDTSDSVNDVRGFKLIELISSFRGELVTILDDLQKEYDALSLEHEVFIAKATSKAEEAIQLERQELIEKKLKKEIGMITNAQVTNWIINNYADDVGRTYTQFSSRLSTITRHIKTLTKLDMVLGQRAHLINESLNRKNRLV